MIQDSRCKWFKVTTGQVLNQSVVCEEARKSRELSWTCICMLGGGRSGVCARPLLGNGWDFP